MEPTSWFPDQCESGGALLNERMSQGKCNRGVRCCARQQQAQLIRASLAASCRAAAPGRTLVGSELRPASLSRAVSQAGQLAMKHKPIWTPCRSCVFTGHDNVDVSRHALTTGDAPSKDRGGLATAPGYAGASQAGGNPGRGGRNVLGRGQPSKAPCRTGLYLGFGQYLIKSKVL